MFTFTFTAPSWCISGGKGRLFGAGGMIAKFKKFKVQKQGAQSRRRRRIELRMGEENVFNYLCNTRYPLSAICHRHRIGA